MCVGRVGEVYSPLILSLVSCVSVAAEIKRIFFRDIRLISAND